MKSIKLAFLTFLAIVALTRLAMAQSEETRNVSGFTGIGNGGSFTVHVKIDGTESCRIKAENAEDLRMIKTEVDRGTLQIRTDQDNNWSNHHFGHVDIYITAKSLSSLSMAGSGSIDVEGMVKGENVRISLGGSGFITGAVESGSLHVSIAGSGNVNLHGTASKADVVISGSGNLKGNELKMDEADIRIAGSGNVNLDVEKSISAYIAGSGNVVYSGNATVANVNSAGSGRVTRMR